MTSTPARRRRNASAIAHRAYPAPHTPAAAHAASPALPAPATCRIKPAARPETVTARNTAAERRASHPAPPINQAPTPTILIRRARGGYPSPPAARRRGGPAARNKAEDSHRARELLDQALATYRELHIRPYRLQVSATSSADSQA